MSKSIFTLIYSERPSDSDALISLNGPFVSSSEKSAVEKVFGYVKDKVQCNLPEEFCEYANERFADFEDILSTHNNDLEDALETFICPHKQREIIDWYFEFMSDDLTECFYQIEEHKI